MKNGVGMIQLIVAQIGNDGSFGQVCHGQANDQAEGEDAIYQPLTKLGLGCKIFVDVKRLGVHRQRGEEYVIHFGHCPPAVFEGHPNFEFVEKFSGHCGSLSLNFSRKKSLRLEALHYSTSTKICSRSTVCPCVTETDFTTPSFKA